MGGQRKKKGGRVTPKGGPSRGRRTPDARAGLQDIFEMVLGSAANDLSDDLPPLAVEMWASQVWSMWATSVLVEHDPLDVFAGGFIAYAAKQATESACMALRALGAVAPEPYGSRARKEADRLAGAGTAERSWAAVIGTGEPTQAWLSYDPIDDDGVNVMVEFDGPGEPNTIGVFIDHNLVGMAKDVFAMPLGVAHLMGIQQGVEGSEQPAFREITLEEASGFWAESLEMTDRMLHPPTSEDFDHLARARLGALVETAPSPASSGAFEHERERAR